jgi:hypothetical protein
MSADESSPKNQLDTSDCTHLPHQINICIHVADPGLIWREISHSGYNNFLKYVQKSALSPNIPY